MGINSIEALKGNRLMLRGVGMTEKELEILGISHEMCIRDSHSSSSSSFI